MKTILRTIALTLFALASTSCTQLFLSPPHATGTAVMGTAMAEARTAIVETQLANAQTSAFWTQIAIPTLTPDLSLPTPFPGSRTQVPAGPGERVYTDPAGWYAINLPDFMSPSGKAGAFAGRDFLLETGYLPYMTRNISLCVWIANILEKAEESQVDPWPPCKVTAKTHAGYVSEYTIFENAAAAPQQRFFYIKSGNLHSRPARVQYTLSWLKPTSTIYATPGPLSTQEAAFWNDPARQLRGASVKEYLLPPEAQVGPGNNVILSRTVPDELQPVWPKWPSPTPTLSAADQLGPLGYELKVVQTQPGYGKQLFRDGKLLIDHVYGVSDVYHFQTDSGPLIAFIVTTTDYSNSYKVAGNSFLIVNDSLHAWDVGNNDPPFRPILYKDELLWIQYTRESHVVIRRSNAEPVFTFNTYYGTHAVVDGFQLWRGHWIMTAGDFVVQDGKILNQTLGYPEIISWRLRNDKPLYLFQRDARIGLAYGDKILRLDYDDVVRLYCCGYASDNPRLFLDPIGFFASRQGAWYYVTIDLNE